MLRRGAVIVLIILLFLVPISAEETTTEGQPQQGQYNSADAVRQGLQNGQLTDLSTVDPNFVRENMGTLASLDANRAKQLVGSLSPQKVHEIGISNFENAGDGGLVDHFKDEVWDYDPNFDAVQDHNKVPDHKVDQKATERSGTQTDVTGNPEAPLKVANNPEGGVTVTGAQQVDAQQGEIKTSIQGAAKVDIGAGGSSVSAESADMVQMGPDTSQRQNLPFEDAKVLLPTDPSSDVKPDQDEPVPKEEKKADPEGGAKLAEKANEGEGGIILPGQPEKTDDEKTKELEQDNPTIQPIQSQPTSTTISGAERFNYDGDTLSVGRADSILRVFDDGTVEISNDVEGFEAKGRSFKVDKAGSVIVDGVQVTDIRNTEFSLLNLDINGNIDKVLGTSLNLGSSQKSLLINPEHAINYSILLKNGKEVKFIGGEDSFVTVSFNDENTYMTVQNASLEVETQGALEENFKEEINADKSNAEAIISDALGVLYLKLKEPAQYKYLPDSIEKTFALQATKETHELYFSKGGRERLRNTCAKCTMIDLVEKTIKINGLLDYKRFFFQLPNNLLDPNLQTVFTQQSPLYAILELDLDLLFIENLVIRNNTGQFHIIPSNWLNLRYEGTKEDKSQGEVFAKFDTKVKKQFVSVNLFQNIINPGNTPIREINDPRSSKKVLTMGSIFFYPKQHQGIIDYINPLQASAKECVFT